jgi:hypothetical protein
MNSKIIIARVAIVIAVICVPVPVAMGNEHGAAMEKQHHAMQTIQREWLKAKSAVEKGYAGSATGPVKKIERSARYMDYFMLHKNPGERDQFLEKTHKFRDLVAKFRRMAEKGNIIALKKLATQIDAACEDCHASFR